MSNKKPSISIGLPVYNGENFLKHTLDSILAQTFKDFEVIIADNASTDSTEKICREYADRDKRICYHRNEENIGAARNYNRVFELSTGKYFKWAAHDDLYASEYLERCFEVLERLPSVVLCYSQVMFVDEQGQQIRKSSSELLNLNSTKPQERFQRYLDLMFFGNLGSGKRVSESKKYVNDTSSSTLTKDTINTSQAKLDIETFDDHPGGDRWTPIFGVIRASILKTTPLIGSYLNSDAILLGELALNGEFYEIPAHLFLYRDHQETSARKHNSYYEYNMWFNQTNKQKMILPLWRWFFEYLKSIKRVKLSWSEKIFCYAQMIRWFYLMLPRLSKELIINFLLVLNIQEVSFGSFKKKVPTRW